jgi:choline-sulfatase
LIVKYPGRIVPGSTTEALVEFIDILPTLLDYCGLQKPEAIQGRSLVPLLTGKTSKHRERVFVEYAQNDEIMVCDERWKLVYIRGKRRRVDGYDPGKDVPLPGPRLSLFDLQSDPGERTNLVADPSQQERVARMLGWLTAHLKATARLPEHVPATNDPMEVLDFCSQPRDVSKAEALR